MTTSESSQDSLDKSIADSSHPLQLREGVFWCKLCGACSCHNPNDLKAICVYYEGKLEKEVINPKYVMNRARTLVDEYKPSRERSLAITKLDEFEMWLSKCEPTEEALNRDGANI